MGEIDLTFELDLPAVVERVRASVAPEWWDAYGPQSVRAALCVLGYPFD